MFYFLDMPAVEPTDLGNTEYGAIGIAIAVVVGIVAIIIKMVKK